MKDESTAGAATYWSHVADAASMEAYKRNEENPLLSAETLMENASLLGFKSFAREYPEKLFPLVYRLRPEFQELFIEFYLLEKSQYFIGPAHGQIQTRVWQNLRIIEQAIGSLIVLGPDPGADILRPILVEAGLEKTEFGSLTTMILLYAKSQNYALVAKAVGSPVPAIRKIFRPAITTLLAAKSVKAVAVGAYLRSLTHQASLTGAGLSKKCGARIKRVKNLRFAAPPAENSPLFNFGNTSTLKDIPWCMFEISSEHRMAQIFPTIRELGKKIFGKKPAQIFAPVNADGELQFGYLFARSATPSLTRQTTRIRGVSEMSATYDDEGNFKHAVTIPNEEVQKLIEQQLVPQPPNVKVGDFVEILTGPASKYCGAITEIKEDDSLIIEVNFPTGRRFVVDADPTCIKLLHIPHDKRAFWGNKF